MHNGGNTMVKGNNIILKNIDKIVSGDINKGILPGDTIIVRDGLIAEIGFKKILIWMALKLFLM